MKAKNNLPKLDRQLGLFDSTMMVVGIVIGSGIFMTTGLMAGALPSASLILNETTETPYIFTKFS